MATKVSEPLGIVISVTPRGQEPQQGGVLAKGKVTGWWKEEVININCPLMTRYRNDDLSSSDCFVMFILFNSFFFLSSSLIFYDKYQ